MTQPQHHITQIVNLYLAAYGEEFALFHEGIKAFRRTLQDEEYGTVDKITRGKGEERALQRALFQMPETLNNLLVMKLLPDELLWFKTTEGGRWFAKKFPAFRLGRVAM